MSDVIWANSPHLPSKVVSIDPGGVNAPYSFTLMPRTQAETVARDNASIVFVPRSGVFDPMTLVADAGDTILDPRTKNVVTSLNMVAGGQPFALAYFLPTRQWFFTNDPEITYAELWEATPVIGIGGVTIQWTHVAVKGGDIPRLFSYAAGVFTSIIQTPITIRFVLQLTNDMVLVGNNSDVEWSYTPVYSGLSPLNMFPITDAFAHSRAGTFSRSHYISNLQTFSLGDTLSIVGATTGDTVDLTDGNLFLDVVD